MFSISKGLKFSVFIMAFSILAACGGGSSSSDTEADTETDTETDTTTTSESTTNGTSTTECDTPATSPHDAFDYFGANVEVALSADGCTVVVTTSGLPDHESFYWDSTHALYEAPTTSQEEHRTPTSMDDGFADDVSLRVSVDPQKATTTTATTLGAVGIAISGGYIYNDNEGGDVQIDVNTAAGLDNSGAHIGPTVYHYHMEPKTFSDDDDSLIGVIADGFFIYGRKCWATATTPDSADLDASGGHTTETEYSSSVEEYHYHIQEDSYYLDTYYLLFPGDYQGSASDIGA